MSVKQVYVKRLYVSVNVKRLHSRQLFNTLIPRARTVGSIAYTLFVWSRLSAPVELSTRYTIPDTTVEIGSIRVRLRNNAEYYYCRISVGEVRVRLRDTLVVR